MRQIRFPVFAALVLAFVTAPLAALDPRARPTPPAAAANAVDFAAPDANVPRVVANLRDEAPGTDLEGKARFVLDRRASELGLTADSTLELHAIRNGKAVDVVRFRQMAAGLPVLRGAVAVSFNHRGEAIFIANDLRPVLGDLDALAADAASPAVGATAARTSALARLGVAGELHHDSSRLMVFPGAHGARVVWALRLGPSSEPYGDWEVLVDAASGEVIRSEDRALYGNDGLGFAYQPDPLASAGATYGDAGYVDGGDADTPQLLAEIFAVPLPELTFETGAWRLKGPYAECVDWGSPFIGCASDADGDFTNAPATASRSADVFEDQNVYHHIDAFMRYMNETLGVTVDPFQYAGGVQFDAHGWDDNDNSSYTSATGRLRFGDGGVDDSEDPDVIIHELGHGIHDWVTNGGLSQINGLSEGVGDYVAASYSRRAFPGTWTPADPEWHWVFKWDGHNPFWGGRLLNWNDNHLYNTGIPNTHTSGQFWSSCNLDIAEVIGYEATDEAMLEGLSMTGGTTNQAQAAQAVIQAAAELGFDLATLNTMATLYNDSSGGFGCNYAVTVPSTTMFSDDFERGNTTRWDDTIVTP